MTHSPGGGVEAMVACAGGFARESPQIIHQDQTQHDGERPQFSDRQRRDGLKGVDEAGEVGLVEAAVAVGHHLDSDRVNSRQAAQGAGRDLGEQLIIAMRQIGENLEQRFRHDVKVVEQPFSVGAKASLCGGKPALIWR